MSTVITCTNLKTKVKPQQIVAAKATLMLTVPCFIIKSSTEDLT